MSDTLLIIEDEDLFGDELVRHYREEGWEAVRAGSLEEARRFLGRALDPLVVIADMNLPDGNALDLLEAVRRQGGVGEWVLITAYGTIPDSVRALRLGAYDFLEKPCSTERLDLVVAGAARSSRAQHQLRDQAAARNLRYAPDAFVGGSTASQRVREVLRKLSTVPFSALVIGGETGTGKGLAARILHYSGPRASGPLVEVNCAALPRDLLEAELFGYEAGAFTGARGRHRGFLEQARGGTLFLDEIGELSQALQAKFLKAIEDHRVRRIGGEREIEIDVQLLAASNRDLSDLVREGAFREDLFHRLSVFKLELPPLRERIEDLDELVPLFVSEFNVKAGKTARVVPPAVWAKLRSHRWPGNVRELRNVIERGVLLSEGELFPEQWLQLPGAGGLASPIAPQPSSSSGDLHLPLDGSMSIDDMEKEIIAAALRRAGHNVTAAARLLGTTRQTLRYRIEKYHLAAREEGED